MRRAPLQGMNGPRETTEPVPAVAGRAFPRLSAAAISGRIATLPDDAIGGVSLVVIVFPESAGQMEEVWSGPFVEAFAANPRVKTYLVMVVGGDRISSSMVGIVDREMRGGFPPEMHDRVLTYPGGFERCRGAFDIDDPSLAYLYLLDDRGVIRWMEKGPALPEGLSAVLERAQDLLGPFWS
jgi:hypothetical protein